MLAPRSLVGVVAVGQRGGVDPKRLRACARPVAVVAIVLMALLGGCGDDDDSTASTSTTTSGASTTSSTAPTSSSSSTTTSAATTASPSTEGTTAPGGAVPTTVTVVEAGPGGGSGEIALRWDAVAGATGYRVLRADGTGGPFAVAAAIDVTTGATSSVAAEVVNIWSASHSYVPSDGALVAADTSPWFEYVEASGATQRCFQVVAVNAAGEAPPSPVACGSPP